MWKDKEQNRIKCKEYTQTLRGNISGRIRVSRYQAKLNGCAMPKTTINQVIEAMQEQNKCCAACKDPLTEGREGYCIDHSHETGEFRGLLCQACNTIEGYAKTAEHCEAVAAYMRDHK